MTEPNSPFTGIYRQTELQKAGIRFDFNTVDTVCRRRCGMTCSLALLVLAVVFAADLHGSAEEDGTRIGFFTLTFAPPALLYVIFYLARYFYYVGLRRRLRRDRAPVTVEAYAVMLLDGDGTWDNKVCAAAGRAGQFFAQYAVVYRECGSKSPRYFLSAAVSSRKICFVPGHIGRVFLRRDKESRLYHLDDQSLYGTVSGRRVFGMSPVLESRADFSDAGGDHKDRSNDGACR